MGFFPGGPPPCGPAGPYGGVVVFDYDAWITRYPEFAAVAQPTAQLYFAEAALYCSNTAWWNLVNFLPKRQMLLNMLTAHVAYLSTPDADGQPRELVGRISTASEGSVSVGTEYASPGTSMVKAYLSQTPYGAAFLAATGPQRVFRYYPGPRQNPLRNVLGLGRGPVGSR